LAPFCDLALRRRPKNERLDDVLDPEFRKTAKTHVFSRVNLRLVFKPATKRPPYRGD